MIPQNAFYSYKSHLAKKSGLVTVLLTKCIDMINQNNLENGNRAPLLKRRKQHYLSGFFSHQYNIQKLFLDLRLISCFSQADVLSGPRVDSAPSPPTTEAEVH